MEGMERAHEVFWNSRPTFSDTAAVMQLDGHLLVWPANSGPGTLDRAGSIVAEHFDGTATVAELAEDFADASGLELEVTRASISDLVVRLATLGLLTGMNGMEEFLAGPVIDSELDDVPEDAGAGADIDQPSDASVDRTVIGEEVVVSPHDGRSMKVTHLADGRTQVSTQFDLDSTSEWDEQRLATEVLAGNRSIAELAPPDTCLGFKLRIGEEIPTFHVQVGDQTLGIRCDDPAITSDLQDHLREFMVESTGPIAVFVVAPLEGDGPCRIFDSIGRRHGRPRDLEEARDLVLHLLAERTMMSGGTTGLAWGALIADDRAVLVAPNLLSTPRLGAAARARGLHLADHRPRLTDNGELDFSAITLPGASLRTPVPLAGIILSDDESGYQPGPRAIEGLLRGAIIEDDTERTHTLDAVVNAVSQVVLIVQSDSSPFRTVSDTADLLRSHQS